ncbi:TPR repeat-containing protein YrrB [bacterium HR36]|nr:TPR repeat-containing protein YrrB [bacterium HR36]
MQLGQWTEVERLSSELCHSLSTVPPEWVNELGVSLARYGRLTLAEQLYRKLVEFYPNYAAGYGNLGLVLRRLGRTDEAVYSFLRALQLDPNFVEALNNLALLLRDMGRLQEAVQYLERAVQIRPNQAVLHANLAQIYRALNRHEHAVRHFRHALTAQPGHLDICLSLSLSLLALGEEAEAENWARHATILAPGSADSWNTLGTILSSMGRYREALDCFNQALQMEPQHHLAHLNRGLVFLLERNWERGWEDYEHRVYLRPLEWQRFAQPRWQGEALSGKTILLVAEQGIGDIVQFVRYAAVLRQQGAHVLLECPKNLVPLLSRTIGVERCYARGESLPGCNFYSPLLSILRYLGCPPENISAPVPYIAADPNLVASWQSKLAQYSGLRVGIAWQGNPNYPNDWQRSVPLNMFRSLAKIAGVTLISLQKGPGEEQLAKCDFEVADLGPERDAAQGAFMDTAAIVQHLDLVICTDSAIAHLAGALGRPIWLLLGYVCDWRWGTTGETTFWYPTMRLFRQQKRGDWTTVFESVAWELQKLAQAKLGRSSFGTVQEICVPVAPGELLDKITILRIKQQRIVEADKRRNVEIELAELEKVAGQHLPHTAELDQLIQELQAVNLALWEVEDALRDCERHQDFGPRFVELARSVYRHNDRRAEIKKRINLLLGSRLVEEKSYRPY